MSWAGLPTDRPLIMGILNATPDSFSDGGLHETIPAAIAAARQMIASGVDIIDIGGESTRPGATPVPAALEQARILPIIAALRDAGATLSIDTRNAGTMQAALAAGAAIVNDVSGLTYDPAAARVVAAAACPVVLMHMRGTPRTMASLATYADPVAEVLAELDQRLQAALQAGIRHDRIAVDPGIGFAKTPEHGVVLLQGLTAFKRLGCPILVGLSRKGLIGMLSGEPVAARRDPGSIAAALFALARGASILRVHDVAGTVQAVRVWQALSKRFFFEKKNQKTFVR